MRKFFKYFFIGIFAVFFVSIGINAADNYDNFSNSIIGKVFGLKPEGPCPDDMVFVSGTEGDFCIDKFEVSASEDCPYVNPQSQMQSRLNLADPKCLPISLPGAYPWRWVSQNQAAELCARAGKRLPTNKEWFQASLGTPDPDSAWGADDCQVDKNWGAQPGMSGQAKKCVSSAGAYDMIGNVWEWVDGTILDGKFLENDLPGQGYVVSAGTDGIAGETDASGDLNYYNDYFWIKKKGLRGMARGGYWDNAEKAGKYAMYLVSPPSYAGIGVGFRCVKSANSGK